MALTPAWPAEPVGVAQPATRIAQARRPLVLVFVAERGMRLNGVIVPSPALDDEPAWRSKAATFAIAIAAILARQFGDIGRQPFGILSAPRDLALRRAVLPERRTGRGARRHANTL